MKKVKKETEAIDGWTAELENAGLDYFDGTTQPFSSPLANAKFIVKIHEKYPYFEFDSRKKEFLNCERCEELTYIRDRSYIGIEEMFGLMGAKAADYNYPVLGNEYKEIWEIYTGRCWNGRNHSEYSDADARYAILCWNILCDNLKKLSENAKGIKKEVRIDELAFLYENKSAWNSAQRLIRTLAGENGGRAWLVPSYEGNKIVSFTYSSPGIQKLLTKAGEILEIYAYYQAASSGYFDEVVNGYRFVWYEEDDLTNELDLVVTKGFQVIIIECKGTKILSQEYYHKLNNLSELFGIEAKKVLLTTADLGIKINHEQAERGKMMGIMTISGLNENIADTLAKLLI